MGTSSAYDWRGRGEVQRAVKKAIRDASDDTGQRRTDAIADVAEKVVTVLRDADEDETDLGLTIADAGTDAADRLCSVVSQVIDGSRPVPETPEDIGTFIADVSGDGDGIPDAIVRRAAGHVAEELAEKAAEHRARGQPLDDELFCTVYRLFHAELLIEAVLALTAESMLPGFTTVVLHTELGKWAMGRVLKLLPNPCEEAPQEGKKPASVAHDLAKDGMKSLLEGAVTPVEAT